MTMHCPNCRLANAATTVSAPGAAPCWSRAFAVADVGVRPGVLVDLLDQVLMAGEVERIHEREAMRVPEAPTAPSGKPRTILHKQERPAAPQPVPVATPPAVQEVRIVESVAVPASEPPASSPEPSEASEPDAADAETPVRRSPPDAEEEPTEVDRILLAKEFAGLLQVPRDDDEASR